MDVSAASPGDQLVLVITDMSPARPPGVVHHADVVSTRAPCRAGASSRDLSATGARTWGVGKKPPLSASCVDLGDAVRQPSFSDRFAAVAISVPANQTARSRVAADQDEVGSQARCDRAAFGQAERSRRVGGCRVRDLRAGQARLGHELEFAVQAFPVPHGSRGAGFVVGQARLAAPAAWRSARLRRRPSVGNRPPRRPIVKMPSRHGDRGGSPPVARA